MEEQKSGLGGSASAKEKRSSPLAATEDHLPTTRMPAMSQPPPLPKRRSSAPPPPVADPLPAFDLTPIESQVPPSIDPPPQPVIARSFARVEPVAPKPSWWRGLLTATFPPPRADQVAAAGVDTLRRRAAIGAAALSWMLVAFALAIGLRGAPAVEPVVAAAVVVSRGLVAVGLIALAVTLLRTAERLFFASPELSPVSPTAGSTNHAEGAPIN